MRAGARRVVLAANLPTCGYQGVCLLIRLFLEGAGRAVPGTKVGVPHESCSQLVRINN